MSPCRIEGRRSFILIAARTDEAGSQGERNLADLASERPTTATLIDLAAVRGPPVPIVCFDRREFSEILNVYGRMVAAGEWRDYAIDTLKDRAVFSIFRRTSEMPLFRIEKNPKLARAPGRLQRRRRRRAGAEARPRSRPGDEGFRQGAEAGALKTGQVPASPGSRASSGNA